jgi:hypothetical protein
MVLTITVTISGSKPFSVIDTGTTCSKPASCADAFAPRDGTAGNTSGVLASETSTSINSSTESKQSNMAMKPSAHGCAILLVMLEPPDTEYEVCAVGLSLSHNRRRLYALAGPNTTARYHKMKTANHAESTEHDWRLPNLPEQGRRSQVAELTLSIAVWILVGI